MPVPSPSSLIEISQVLPYVKAPVSGSSEQPELTDVDLISLPLVGSLHVTYVVDRGDRLQYIMESDLDGQAVTREELHELAVRNFGARVSAQGGVHFASQGSIIGLL